MRSPLLVITGTGTGVGKTYTACVLLRAWTGHGAAAGYKPIETGVPRGREGADARKLRASSSFHVKLPPTETFEAPLSPHLAAARAGRIIPVSKVIQRIRALRRHAFGLVVELPGGLFTPLAPGVRNADLIGALDPTAVVAVAPDRLGVLHDLGALSGAAAHLGLQLSGIVLNAPRTRDASTGTNFNEVMHITSAPVLFALGRGPPKPTPSVEAALARLLGGSLSESAALALAPRGRRKALPPRDRRG